MSRKDGVLVCHCLSANSSHWQQHHYSNCCRLEHEGHTPPKKHLNCLLLNAVLGFQNYNFTNFMQQSDDHYETFKTNTVELS
jgi:hypothetical protein